MNDPYDLIIIGGGINGAGIALEAARRRLKTLLLEKKDFGSGTTSASTRLIHGGLRYLEHFEFALVRESLRDREFLLHATPHLVKPLPLLIPIYAGNKRGRRLIKLGMMLYDFFSYDKSLPAHRMLTPAETIALEPGIRRNGLKGAALYYDAQVDLPERLCLAMALEARVLGAEIRNYHMATKLVDAGEVKTVEAQEVLIGDSHQFEGKVVMNVAGPWVDEVRKMRQPNAEQKIGGTKGSHLVVRKFHGAPTHAVYAEARSDGRPIFIIPWRENYLIGTTDLAFTGNPDDAIATEAEVDYLLEEANHVLANGGISRSDILYTYAGVRPLPFSPGKPESSITRRHLIVAEQDRLGRKTMIDVIGGKLTTFRSLAQQAVDQVCKLLGRNNQPAASFLREDNSGRVSSLQTEVDAALLKHLEGLYGVRAGQVLQLAEQQPELKAQICPNNPDILAQIAYGIEHEMARTLEDLVMRRTGIGWSACQGLDCIEKVAVIAARYWGWDEDRIRREVVDFRLHIGQRFRPTFLS